MGVERLFITRAEALVPYLVCHFESEGYDYRYSGVWLLYRHVGRGERGVGVFFQSGPAVEMGDVGAGMEYQQTVGVAADDGEDGSGDAVEVVVFTRGAAHSIVLDVEEQSGVIGQAADVLGTVAGGGIGGGVGCTQPLGGVDGDVLVLGHYEDVAVRVDALAEILDVGAEDAACVDTGRVDDEKSSLEAADAHFLERPDDGSLGTREIAAEVATEVICVDCAFHRCCKDKSPFGGFCD